MKKSNIIISDITCMKEKFCIAGWDIGEKRMKRLLIDNMYWDEKDIPTYSVINVENEPLTTLRDYPHQTEDTNINLDSIKVLEIYQPDGKLAQLLKDSVSKDIQTIFDDNVIYNSYIHKKTKCASLGAIVIPTSKMEFFIENGKLRAKVMDSSDKKYDLKVSSKYLRDIFEKTKDVEKLNNMLNDAKYVHLRIGLARPFLIQDNHCYLMLNGVFLY